MEDKLIQFIKDNIDMDDVRHTYSKMVICRCSLDYQNYNLYCQINDLIDDFCNDNKIDNDFDTFEIFDKLFD